MGAFNVIARLSRMKVWRIGVPLIIGVISAALAAGLSAGRGQPPVPGIPGTGVVLKKLAGLQEFRAAQAVYSFRFTDVVHKSFLFFTGEAINVDGSGTDDAIINFSSLPRTSVVRTSTSSVLVYLPVPQLGAPEINLGQTVLSQKEGIFTHLVNIAGSYPGDAEKALQMAGQKIRYAAAKSNLIGTAETSARSFLTAFLRKLGFEHITVTFI